MCFDAELDLSLHVLYVSLGSLTPFLHAAKVSVFSNFHVPFSSLSIFLSFFLIQASCLHEDLLILLPFCSPLMLLFELAGLCRRNTLIPFLPRHLSYAVCQQGRTASILLLANFFLLPAMSFYYNFFQSHISFTLSIYCLL